MLVSGTRPVPFRPYTRPSATQWFVACTAPAPAPSHLPIHLISPSLSLIEGVLCALEMVVAGLAKCLTSKTLSVEASMRLLCLSTKVTHLCSCPQDPFAEIARSQVCKLATELAELASSWGNLDKKAKKKMKPAVLLKKPNSSGELHITQQQWMPVTRETVERLLAESAVCMIETCRWLAEGGEGLQWSAPGAHRAIAASKANTTPEVNSEVSSFDMAASALCTALRKLIRLPSWRARKAIAGMLFSPITCL